ncbi:FAD/NAD(P)-binding domain-containing protein [Didymella exigua CBS 183.55]|uniref:FAD/NAD(P)-binding domain-containing protein n=1 Tax=Didymella exigua CBS 183.55 TaxID=1150837 RepID=A0A6A5S1V3_9PLEO|nr:FAD/NAD(P)-binding domain-containing protein [Didymella exigua CBS 183.55]KAF1931507.1 FAD/NAD(P)-binding domain-containing protein [Didymella exigua CBS 183.55]
MLLIQDGARIAIVEKGPALLPHGQNVDITGVAMTVIKKMGLFDEVKRYHTQEEGTQLVDHNGRPLASFPIKENSIASFTSEFEILRGDMAKILWEASRAQTSTEFLFDTTIQQVLHNDDDSVKIELSNGSVQEFDLLVVADGQWSKLRKQVFVPESVNVIDKNMYVVYFTVPKTKTDNKWWNVYIGLQSRIITLRPDPHGTTRAMFTIMPHNEAQKIAWRNAIRAGRTKQEQLVKQEFASVGWEARRLLDAMSAAPDFYFHPMQQIKMDRWSHNRVICLGDTAFAPTPLTGMGTSLAILGGCMLAGELAQLQPDQHPMSALDAYEKAFRPFVEQTQKIPGILPGAVHPDMAWERWLLQSGISVVAWAASFPSFARLIGGNRTAEENNNGFKLPRYEKLDRML